jgi:hypothetical protein
MVLAVLAASVLAASTFGQIGQRAKIRRKTGKTISIRIIGIRKRQVFFRLLIYTRPSLVIPKYKKVNNKNEAKPCSKGGL